MLWKSNGLEITKRKIRRAALTVRTVNISIDEKLAVAELDKKFRLLFNV
jgi:hypothetical protein